MPSTNKNTFTKVLYIEGGVDEKASSHILEECLAMLDFPCVVTVVNSPFTALECTEHTYFRIIFIASGLMGLNSINIFKILRSVKCNIPLVLMMNDADDSSTSQEEELLFANTNFDGIIQLPFSDFEFCNCIVNTLQRASLRNIAHEDKIAAEKTAALSAAIDAPLCSTAASSSSCSELLPPSISHTHTAANNNTCAKSTARVTAAASTATAAATIDVSRSSKRSTTTNSAWTTRNKSLSSRTCALQVDDQDGEGNDNEELTIGNINAQEEASEALNVLYIQERISAALKKHQMKPDCFYTHRNSISSSVDHSYAFENGHRDDHEKCQADKDSPDSVPVIYKNYSAGAMTQLNAPDAQVGAHSGDSTSSSSTSSSNFVTATQPLTASLPSFAPKADLGGSDEPFVKALARYVVSRTKTMFEQERQCRGGGGGDTSAFAGSTLINRSSASASAAAMGLSTSTAHTSTTALSMSLTEEDDETQMDS